MTQKYKKCDEILEPADGCVLICVNVQYEPVVILNGNISLLCVELTAEIGKYTKQVSSYFGFLCRFIRELWGRSE